MGESGNGVVWRKSGGGKTDRDPWMAKRRWEQVDGRGGRGVVEAQPT